MDTLTTQRLVTAGGTIVLLIFLGYNLFSGINTEVKSDEQMQTVMVGEDILVLVERLNRISIDKDLFSSRLFTSLVDFSTDLYPESQGRSNPFALFGVEVPFSTNVSTSSQRQ